MLWGGFSYTLGPLPCHVWPPQTNVDGARYVEDILECIVGPWIDQFPVPAPDKRPIFMQDGARAHWGPGALAWFAARAAQVELMTRWPAHSPDMNPIEQLWAPLKSIVNVADMAAGSLRELMYAAWAIVSRREKTGIGGPVWEKHQSNLVKVVTARGDNRHQTA